MIKSDTREAAEARFLKALDAFVSEANDSKQMAVLVDALTWTLARIAVGCGTANVAGDILSRLGRHIVHEFEHQRARDESVKIREAGRLPH